MPSRPFPSLNDPVYVELAGQKEPVQGVVAYIGPVDFAEGSWVGVRLTGISVGKGKNDGSVKGKRYFGNCGVKDGIFVRAWKLSRPNVSKADDIRMKHKKAVPSKPMKTKHVNNAPSVKTNKIPTPNRRKTTSSIVRKNSRDSKEFSQNVPAKLRSKSSISDNNSNTSPFLDNLRRRMDKIDNRVTLSDNDTHNESLVESGTSATGDGNPVGHESRKKMHKIREEWVIKKKNSSLFDGKDPPASPTISQAQYNEQLEISRMLKDENSKLQEQLIIAKKDASNAETQAKVSSDELMKVQQHLQGGNDGSDDSSLVELEALREDVTALLSKNDVKKATQERLWKALKIASSLQSKLEQVEKDCAEEVSELKSELLNVSKERNTLKQRATISGDSSLLEKRNLELEDAAVKSAELLQSSKAEYDKIQEEKLELIRKVEDLSLGLTNTNLEIENLKNDLEDYKAEVEEAQERESYLLNIIRSIRSDPTAIVSDGFLSQSMNAVEAN